MVSRVVVLEKDQFLCGRQETEDATQILAIVTDTRILFSL